MCAFHRRRFAGGCTLDCLALNHSDVLVLTMQPNAFVPVHLTEFLE